MTFSTRASHHAILYVLKGGITRRTRPCAAERTIRLDGLRTRPRIGPVIATKLLITRHEMQPTNDVGRPKKLACQAGVARFECRSGTSVCIKTKVSHQARKRLKSLIHMGTMSAIEVKGDLRD